MIAVIGLGNKGAIYRYTRHNAGFILVDEIACQYQMDYKSVDKLKAEVAIGSIDAYDVILVKPQTMMNNSGSSVRLITKYYNINLNDLIVIHDDLDLSLGKIKIKLGGGSGGHNGLKSIDQLLGISYHRLRIGIGRPLDKTEVTDYVLDKFTREEEEVLNFLKAKIVANMQMLLCKQHNELQTLVNQKI